MLKEIIRKAVSQIRTVVVVFAVAALTMSGVSSAERILGAYTVTGGQVKSLPPTAQLLPGPPSPEDIPQNMSPSGKPDAEAYAYFTAAPLIDFSKVDSRFAADCPEAETASRTTDGADRKSSVRSSASKISSHLGIQFTLVGAKPSGTS